MHLSRHRAATVMLVCSLSLSLAGCGSSLPNLPKFNDINPFAKKEVPLEGERVSILETTGSINELAPADKPVILPSPRVNADWPQAGGSAGNAPGHLALGSSLKQAWSAGAGSGSSSAGRLTATPIVADGRIYTLDIKANVNAFAMSGGATVWRTPLLPPEESGSFFSFSLGSNTAGGFGGGLAFDGGRLFVATGYGSVFALDPRSGKKLWEKKLSAPVRAAPAASADRVFVLATDGRFYALAGSDGNELWTFRGLPEQASLVSSAAPAVSGDSVIVPFPSGEVVALKIANGQTAWTESLSRTRGGSAMATMSDAARPVADGGIVYSTGHGGRMLATQISNGERLWSISVTSTQGPTLAGDNLFVVDTVGKLIALDRRTGNALWTVKLPGSTRWAGPVVAGGAVWLASDQGTLISADAVTGRIKNQQDLGSKVFINPIVAQNRMFVLTDNARLIALN